MKIHKIEVLYFQRIFRRTVSVFEKFECEERIKKLSLANLIGMGLRIDFIKMY